MFIDDLILVTEFHESRDVLVMQSPRKTGASTKHHGFDWHEVQIAAEDGLEGKRTRGTSTITQQLVKNLFFGTAAHSPLESGV